MAAAVADRPSSSSSVFRFHISCHRCHHYHISLPLDLPSDGSHQRYYCTNCRHHLFGVGSNQTQISLASVCTLSSWDETGSTTPEHDHTHDQEAISAPQIEDTTAANTPQRSRHVPEAVRGESTTATNTPQRVRQLPAINNLSTSSPADSAPPMELLPGPFDHQKLGDEDITEARSTRESTNLEDATPSQLAKTLFKKAISVAQRRGKKFFKVAPTRARTDQIIHPSKRAQASALTDSTRNLSNTPLPLDATHSRSEQSPSREPLNDVTQLVRVIIQENDAKRLQAYRKEQT